MSFIVRSVRTTDIHQLVDLARQFTLLNLPGDKKILISKIERSIESFAGNLQKQKSEFLFVVEDLEEKLVVGSSLILAKHGTEHVPHNFFKIIKKNHFSSDLGVGFIHQVLRFQMDYDGPSEIGGLLIDKIYRRRPEKLGKQISLARFNYMSIHPDRFEERVLCELTPPLTEEGRSEFWEALGRRFTGLPYQEADILSQSHKEFISSLFPEEDIYVCLLDSKARTVIGRVGEATRPAQHLLESVGFEYLEEVDPFDGGPHYGADVKDILPVKYMRRAKLAEFSDSVFQEQGLIGVNGDEYRCVVGAYEIRDNEVSIAATARRHLGVELGESVYISPFNYKEEPK
jgi:arginine N-succinyltransferase